MEKTQWLGELANFIVEANGKTWAAEGAEVTPERKGYKELEYQRDDWRLRDSYTGYFRAPGMTTVYFKGQPAWTMMYGGPGQIEGYEGIVKPTFAFLKKALMQVTPEMPFRGPPHFQDREEGWQYVFELASGDITDFLGHERISKLVLKPIGGLRALTYDDVFKQTVMGGIIIPKDADRKPVYPWNF